MSQLLLNVDNDLEDQTIKFQVDGKILNELSKQVTSHIFALGELIKNSYDAQATSIEITLNLKEKLLIINDNGIGVSKENIQSILHIAKSNKEYAKKFTFTLDGIEITRLTQGSKGLGLFSAFKFGNTVNWDTKYDTNDSYSLTVNKNEVTKLADINNAIFKLETGERNSRGTTIRINLDNNYDEIIYTYNYFKEHINAKRLVNFFLDDSLTIEFNLINEDGKAEDNFPIKTTKRKALEKQILEKNLFKIFFSNNDNSIDFFYKNVNKPFKSYPYKIENKLYTIKFTIYAFIFKAGEKKLINSLFLNSRNDLTPLIYINGALFNNDNIFDPSITRKIKSSKSLSQLVGFIEISCTHPDLQFNNERTDLVFNSLNENLKNDIKKINIFLQEKGKYLEKNLASFISEDSPTEPEDNPTELKDSPTTPQDNPTELKDSPTTPQDNPTEPKDNPTEPKDNPTTPKDNPTEPKDNPTTPQDNPTESKDNPTQPEANNIIEPYINLKGTEITKEFENFPKTIDLKSFFEDARDSNNNPVFIEEINITVNNNPINHPFIEQINYASTLKVCYFFYDKFAINSYGNAVKCCEYLNLNIKQKNNEFTAAADNLRPLISPIGPKYTFYFNDVNKLIDQINSLWLEKNSYDMCIAAALRLVFDLTLYNYEKISGNVFKSKDLGIKVEKLINEIKEYRPHFTNVAKLLDPRFSLVDNIFESPNQFAQKATISNLGSHTGSSHLSMGDIKDLAQYAGYFAQLVDAHCKIKFGNH
ncbi:ATP-binding protein [Acinetobacter baumannii]|nr:ATP-binding protein [Acinetobacter baumannii]MDC4426219.1 ATP-binding protein [Acinetobacter baumannii]